MFGANTSGWLPPLQTGRQQHVRRACRAVGHSPVCCRRYSGTNRYTAAIVAYVFGVVRGGVQCWEEEQAACAGLVDGVSACGMPRGLVLH